MYCRVLAATLANPRSATDAVFVALLEAGDKALTVQRCGAREVTLPAGGFCQVAKHDADAIRVAGRAEDVVRLREPDSACSTLPRS